MAEALVQGRSAFAASAWAAAYEWLSAADRRAPLEPDDLERLATAAYLVGRDDQSAELWARAHHELRGRGDPERAARCAFWLAFGLLNRASRPAVAAGWPGPGGSWPTAPRTGPSTATCAGWPRSSRSWTARPRPPWPGSRRRPPPATAGASPTWWPWPASAPAGP